MLFMTHLVLGSAGVLGRGGSGMYTNLGSYFDFIVLIFLNVLAHYELCCKFLGTNLYACSGHVGQHIQLFW